MTRRRLGAGVLVVALVVVVCGACTDSLGAADAEAVVVSPDRDEVTVHTTRRDFCQRVEAGVDVEGSTARVRVTLVETDGDEEFSPEDPCLCRSIPDGPGCLGEARVTLEDPLPEDVAFVDDRSGDQVEVLDR